MGSDHDNKIQNKASRRMALNDVDSIFLQSESCISSFQEVDKSHMCKCKNR